MYVKKQRGGPSHDGKHSPPVMFEKVVIQLGLHFNLCQKSNK